MKRLIYKLFFLSVLFIGLTACDDQDETEYWLAWYMGWNGR